jgi:hypothetical protein
MTSRLPGLYLPLAGGIACTILLSLQVARADSPEEVALVEGAAYQADSESVFSRDRLDALIRSAAEQYGVERALARAVVAVESAYDVQAVSPVGAVGLMQVMPATAVDYGVTNTAALFDPATNLRTGIRHLKRLLDKYGNDYGRAIMAYNAGEGVVDRTNSKVTYTETLDYTEAVIGHYRRNGGSRPMESALQRVRALRRISDVRQAQRSTDDDLELSVGRIAGRGKTQLHHLDASFPRDLAAGELDAASKADISDFGELPRGDL